MGTADQPSQNNRYYTGRDDTTKYRRERVQVRRSTVRVGVTEVRLGGQSGSGNGGGAEKPQQQRNQARSKRCL